MTATTLPLTISFVGDSKGGVGKSFCCRGLYEYHLVRRLPIVGFEADLRKCPVEAPMTPLPHHTVT